MPAPRRRKLVAAVAVTVLALGGGAALQPAASAAQSQDHSSPPVASNAPWTKTVSWLEGQLSLDEKLGLVHGGTDPDPHGSAGFIQGVSRLGIPDVRHADAQGVNVYKDATAYPGRLGLAASFDRGGLSAFGKAVGDEGRALDVDLLYGPQVDLARMPTWTRNMTTYGEDPYLAAQLTGIEINGIQSTGLLSQVKHFSFYNGQNQSTPSIVNDQAAHELYLQSPEAAVKDGKVSSVMCSYATYQITPVESRPDYACSNSGGLKGILKGQWGFTGWVTSDYTASKAVSDLLAGMDQEFATNNLASASLKPLVDPASPTYNATYAQALNEATARILYQYERFGLLDDSTYPASAKTKVRPISAAPAKVDKQRGIALAHDLAVKTGVLLKNDGGTLPLSTSRAGKIAITGPTADLMPSAPNGERARGYGDRNTISPLDALKQQAGNAKVTYAPGIDRVGTTVPAGALATSDAAGAKAGLTRTETDSSGNVISTKVDTTLDGKQTDLVKGHTYSWEGYLNAPSADTYSLWLQRPAGTTSGNTNAYNHGVNPGLQQGGGRGATPNTTLSVDDTARTLVSPSTILQNTYPGGPTVNGQYLGLDDGGADIALSSGPHKIKVTYAPTTNAAAAPTFRFAWSPQQGSIDAAVAAAKDSTTAVVFADDANTTTTAGNVGTLGPNQDKLIQAVADANPNTVVVLNTDGAVQMPWLKSVKSVLEMWYPGQEGGAATADLLLGKANPSGKLPLTFPAGNDATPFAGHPERSTGVDGKITWSEGLDIGYRWYEDTKTAPLFPFGYGLSYTSFDYSHLKASGSRDGGLDVRVTVRNNGRRTGVAVPQVYVGPSADLPSTLQQSSEKLVQFDRVQLAPGRSTTVSLHIAPRDLSSWSTAKQAWVLGTGKRVIKAGSSSSSLPAVTTAVVHGH
jgi:beta-glucosidase